eukprot:COSAG01_NODE_36579_length_515_cov_4.461538_1_plen_23_part_01
MVVTRVTREPYIGYSSDSRDMLP